MKPATPLPWQQDDDTYILGPDGSSVLAPTLDGEDRGECYEAQDAAYIVHACNAYPRLVEALGDILAVLSHDPDNARLARAIYGNGAADKARALLRELGEAE